MSILETQEMEEAAALRQWEEINEASGIEEESEEMDRCRVYDFLNDSLDDFSEGYDRLAYAAEAAHGFPMEDRIMSIANDLDRLADAVKKLMSDLKKEAKSA
jgi:hypothetical protein